MFLIKKEHSDLSNLEDINNLSNIKASNMHMYGIMNGYELSILKFLDEYNKDIPEHDSDELTLPDGFYFEDEHFLNSEVKLNPNYENDQD